MKKAIVLLLSVIAMMGVLAQEFSAWNFEATSYKETKPAPALEMKNLEVVKTVPVFTAYKIAVPEVEKLFSSPQNPPEWLNIAEVSDRSGNTALRKAIQMFSDINIGGVEKRTNMRLNSNETAEIYEKLIPNIKDYYINHDRKFSGKMNKEIWRKWITIFDRQFEPVPYVKYDLPDVKFIFEIRTPKNLAERENLFKELDHFWMLGYRGVVTVWDGKANYRDLAELQNVLRLNGWRVWTSFSTHDYLSDSAYIDPDLYEAGLKALAKDAEAFLMGWRRTSIHLFIPDPAWTSYTMHNLRAGNPNIAFIGEYYFGYNGTHTAGEWHEYVNIPANANAVFVVNLGFMSIKPDEALKQVRKKVGDKLPLVSLIQGETSYFMSLHNTNRSKEVNRRISFLLEERFLKAGFDMVATTAGDGSNGMYNGKGIDNMCLSKNHQ